MVVGVVRRKTMSLEPIPPEIRAGVEANALFDALRRGDYVTAARAQVRLRELGWHLSRETPRAYRRRKATEVALEEAAP
jgi:hypothetical protein